MNDDMGRPLLDFHTLDACPHCERNQMIHIRRLPYHDEEVRKVPNMTVCTWDCPDCGVIYQEYEDLDGHFYDIEGQPLSN